MLLDASSVGVWAWCAVAVAAWIVACRDPRHRPLVWLLASFAAVVGLEGAATAPRLFAVLEGLRAIVLAVVVGRVFGAPRSDGRAGSPEVWVAAGAIAVLLTEGSVAARIVPAIALLSCWVVVVVGIAGDRRSPHVAHLILIFLVVDQSVSFVVGGLGLGFEDASRAVLGIDRLSQAACVGAYLSHLRGSRQWSPKAS